jgi:hypothetical protein
MDLLAKVTEGKAMALAFVMEIISCNCGERGEDVAKAKPLWVHNLFETLFPTDSTETEYCVLPSLLEKEAMELLSLCNYKTHDS